MRCNLTCNPKRGPASTLLRPLYFFNLIFPGAHSLQADWASRARSNELSVFQGLEMALPDPFRTLAERGWQLSLLRCGRPHGQLSDCFDRELTSHRRGRRSLFGQKPPVMNVGFSALHGGRARSLCVAGLGRLVDALSTVQVRCQSGAVKAGR